MSTPTQQPTSIYTFMIVVSAILMFLACLLMSLEFARWGANPREETGVRRSSMLHPASPLYVSHHSGTTVS